MCVFLLVWKDEMEAKQAQRSSDLLLERRVYVPHWLQLHEQGLSRLREILKK